MVANSKTWRRVTLLQLAKFSGVVLVGLVVIYFISVGPKLLGWQDISSDSEPNGSENRVNQGPIERVTEFEKVIDSQSPLRLKEYYAKLKNWPDAPVVIQLENLEKRHVVLDALLRHTSDDESEKFVRARRLETLTERERIAIVYNAYDATENNRIVEFCVDHHADLDGLCAIGMSMAAISRFLACKDFDERKSLRESAYKKFVDFLGQQSTKPEIEEAFADQIRLLIEYSVNPEAIPFAVAYLRTYSDSKNPSVMASVKEFAKMAGSNRILLPSIIDVPPELRDRKVQQFQVQAEAMLNTATAENMARGLPQLIARTRDLVRLGRMDAAKSVVSQIAPLAAKDRSLERPFNDLSAAIELIGSPFNASGLKNIRGQQIKFRSQNEKRTILLLVAPGKLAKCASWCQTIKTMLGENLDDFVYRLVLIKKNGQQNRNALVELANQMNVKPIVLDFDTSEGLEFGKRVFVDEVPFLILLDENNRYLAVGPPVDLVGELLGVDANKAVSLGNATQ